MKKQVDPDRTPAAFSWFPGHMRTAWRRVQEDLAQVDVLLSLMDARIGRTSHHPALETSLSKRGIPVIRILTKTDLAEPNYTKEWIEHFQAKGQSALSLDSRGGGGVNALKSILLKLDTGNKKRSILPRPTRVMVVGLPNVGKSSLLNRLIGKAKAKTGKKPGLTRGNSQWVTSPEGFSVLDSPGILYPRIETWEQVALLGACGNIRHEVLPYHEVAPVLLQKIVQLGKQEMLPERSIEDLGRRLGFLLPGAVVDEDRTTRWLLAACFEGRLGRITWERLHG